MVVSFSPVARSHTFNELLPFTPFLAFTYTRGNFPKYFFLRNSILNLPTLSDMPYFYSTERIFQNFAHNPSKSAKTPQIPRHILAPKFLQGLYVGISMILVQNPFLLYAHLCMLANDISIVYRVFLLTDFKFCIHFFIN